AQAQLEVVAAALQRDAAVGRVVEVDATAVALAGPNLAAEVDVVVVEQRHLARAEVRRLGAVERDELEVAGAVAVALLLVGRLGLVGGLGLAARRGLDVRLGQLERRRGGVGLGVLRRPRLARQLARLARLGLLGVEVDLLGDDAGVLVALLLAAG